MGKFDLSRIVGAAGVSESDTELREIPLEKLVENRANFYPPIPQTDQEALEDSIEANGLLEPDLRTQPAAGAAAAQCQIWWQGAHNGPVPGAAAHGRGRGAGGHH